jgi:hypothetical protein
MLPDFCSFSVWAESYTWPSIVESVQEKKEYLFDISEQQKGRKKQNSE